MLLLVTMVIGLPVYWVLEPGRQAGAVSLKEETFVKWGGELFETTANGGFNCAGCHGGMKAAGGQAPTAVTDPKTGEVEAVNWYAPALNTVLYRFTGDEVQFILDYGRTFSPMSAWGTDRRRPDERPADRDDHRLHPQHPAPAGELPHRARVPDRCRR